MMEVVAWPRGPVSVARHWPTGLEDHLTAKDQARCSLHGAAHRRAKGRETVLDDARCRSARLSSYLMTSTPWPRLLIEVRVLVAICRLNGRRRLMGGPDRQWPPRILCTRADDRA